MRILRRQRTRGQGLVEFALVLPIFLFLLFSIVDAGRYVFVNSALSNAAREGARLGSVEASWVGSSDPSCGGAAGPVCPNNDTQLRNHITTAANRQMAPFGQVGNLYVNCTASTTPPSGAWTTTTCANNTPGSLLSVRVTYSWRAITPIIGNVLGTINTQASSSVLIN
jgi:Flp pilus assembly protein TadG